MLKENKKKPGIFPKNPKYTSFSKTATTLQIVLYGNLDKNQTQVSECLHFHKYDDIEVTIDIFLFNLEYGIMVLFSLIIKTNKWQSRLFVSNITIKLQLKIKQ
jgi:hypothetical protein